jgi:hypothetical protein
MGVERREHLSVRLLILGYLTVVGRLATISNDDVELEARGILRERIERTA